MMVSLVLIFVVYGDEDKKVEEVRLDLVVWIDLVLEKLVKM